MAGTSERASARAWPHRLALFVLYAGLLGTAAYFAVAGRSFYLTPVAERARHELYWELKPGGTLGLKFGIAGAGMMALMLLYSARKRLAWMHRWGPISAWLDFHILLGICGPVFICLHSSLKVGGIVSLAFWSMVAVALSGVVGRYLYRLIPHTPSGDEISLAEANRLDRELSLRLVEDFGLTTDEVARLDARVERDAAPNRSLLALFLQLPFARWARARDLRELGNRHPQTARALRRQLGALLESKAQLRLRIALWLRVRQLFRYWHVLHKPFAVTLYLFMIVHVVVAWVTGYAWSGR